MTEWFRNLDWNKDIEEIFETKLKRARGNDSKAQYLRIQGSYLLSTKKFGVIGKKMMLRLFAEFPNEKFSVSFGHEELADYYFRNKEYSNAESEYLKVVQYYKTKTRSGTTGLGDIKLADLLLHTNQSDKYQSVYKLITEDFEINGGNLLLNDSKYFYYLTTARLANKLGYNNISKDYAVIALDLSEIIDPQFPRHKSVGIVKAKKQDIKELKIIIQS